MGNSAPGSFQERVLLNGDAGELVQGYPIDDTYQLGGHRRARADPGELIDGMLLCSVEH